MQLLQLACCGKGELDHLTIGITHQLLGSQPLKAEEKPLVLGILLLGRIGIVWTYRDEEMGIVLRVIFRHHFSHPSDLTILIVTRGTPSFLSDIPQPIVVNWEWFIYWILCQQIVE